MSIHQPSLSVVIPCYNEESIIYTTIATVVKFLSAHHFTFEIIPVSDGSTDKTEDEIRRACADMTSISIRPLFNTFNQGKGAAVRDGVLKSVNDVVVFIDADLTVSIEELLIFLPELARADIVIASRALPHTLFEEQNPWYRDFLAKGFRFFQTIILGNSDTKDTQCGFKIFTKKSAQTIFKKLTVKRFAFDAEALYLANKLRYTIKQLPVTIRKDHRKSRVNAITDPVNMFFALLKIRLNDILGKYSS